MKKFKKTGTIRSRIKRGDEVVFVVGKEFNRFDSSGKRKPYTGKVIAVQPHTRKVKVEGAMIVKKHQKPNPQLNLKGGIIEKEAWVDISNVAIIDPKTGEPSRIGYEMRDGVKVRISKKSGTVIPEPGIFVKKATEEISEEKEADKKEKKPAAKKTESIDDKKDVKKVEKKAVKKAVKKVEKKVEKK